VPPQNVTLAQLLDLGGVDATLPPLALSANPPSSVEPLTLGEIDLRSTPVRSISLLSLALGSTPVRSIPIEPNTGDSQADWCAFLQSQGFDCGLLGLNVDTTTVLSLEFAGVPVAATVADTPVRSIDLAASPVRSIPVRSIDVTVSPVRSILVRDLPPGIVDCTIMDCSPTSTQDLGDAQEAGAILATAIIDQLLPFLPPDVTLRDLLLTLIPLDNIAWEEVPLENLLPFAGREVTYTLSFTNEGVGPLEGATVSVELPAGFGYEAGSSEQTAPIAGDIADPVVNGSTLTWTLATPVQPAETFVMTFVARPSFNLGTFTSSLTVDGPGTSDALAGAAALRLVESFEPNDTLSPAPPVLEEDVLQISHISFAQDRDLSRIAVPAVGMRISYFLSHLPQDADLDAVLHEPNASPVRSIPVRSIGLQSVPLPDNGFDADPSDDALDPEIRQDLNTIGSIPVRSISAHEGAGTETIETTALDGDGGYYTQVVTGYNGAHSSSPYVQRYNVTSPRPAPQCSARALPFAGARATAAPAIPAGVNTLILTSQERLGSLYGTVAASNVMTSLNTLAGASAAGVTGAVVQVDFYSDVAAAYAAWDANPCSPDAANAIVDAILGHVDDIRVANPGIEHIVIAGSDEVVPHARVFDGVTVSNESSYAGEIAGLATGAISASLLTGNVLSDDPYGDLDPIAWLGRELYLPDQAVGRVVETPQEIVDAVARFVLFDGVLDAGTTNSALVSGYDFLSDGADGVADALDARPGAQASARLIDDTWDGDALLGAMFGGATPGVLSPNAHYDHFELLPAAGNTTGTTSDLVTTADIASPPVGVDALLGRAVFTMGCHSGLNVPDVIVAAPSPAQAASLQDWAQAYGQGGTAAYVGNTGYGYGDTLTSAYSERLMTLFAERLDGSMTAGEAMMFAKQEYFAGLGTYGEYDLKVISESVYYGLPMYRVDTGVAGPPLSLAVIQSTPGLVPDASTGLDSTSFEFVPTFERVPADDSPYYYKADGMEPQTTHYRLPMPRLEQDVTSPDASLMAHGVLITDLESQYEQNYVPPITRPLIDLAENEPPPEFGSFALPAAPALISTYEGASGTEQRLVFIAGQFETTDGGSPAGIGTLRLDTNAKMTVLYSDSDDWTPPTIRSTQAFTDGGFVSFAVEADDDSGAPLLFVGVLLTTGDGDWELVRLIRTPGTNRYTGGTQVPAGSEIKYYVQAFDDAGNGGQHGNKARLNVSEPIPAPASEFDVSVNGPLGDNGWFVGAASVTVDGPDTYQFSVDGGAPSDYVGPFAVNGDGVRIVEVTGINGAETTFVVPVDTAAPEVSLRAPVDGEKYGEALSIPADFDCSDGGSGVVECEGTVADGADINTVLGPHVFTVTARDAAGRETSFQSAYSVVSCSFVVDPTQSNNDRDFIDLPPTRPYDDLTAAFSDQVNDVCDDDDDNDGLSDLQETAGPPCETASAATNPLAADTDGDLILDGAECALGFDPASAASKPVRSQCAPAGDDDGDKVINSIEFCNYNTDPSAVNTDGDSCGDGREIGSINADKSVNIIDLFQIASAGGSPAKYILNFDLTKNGTIDVMDLQLAALVYGDCP
jgi:hypothetical protein